jgi:hypothetical protein
VVELGKIIKIFISSFMTNSESSSVFPKQNFEKNEQKRDGEA